MWRSCHSHLWLVNTIISGLCCQGKQAQPNVKGFSPCPIGNIIHKLKMPNKLSEILIIPVKYRIAGKFGGMFRLANLLFSSIWQKKVWRMNRPAKGMDGWFQFGWFSLVNRRRFAKFAKLSSYTVFPMGNVTLNL